MRTKAEEDFLPESMVLAPRAVARIAYFLSIIVVTSVTAFIVWADYAVLDEVTRGDGRVVPSSQIQIVQHPEGGVVQEILAREGDIVDRNELLLRVESAITESDFREKRGRYLAQIAAIARAVGGAGRSSARSSFIAVAPVGEKRPISLIANGVSR